ncbi:GntR family transcriptional regulator [Enterococcus sp. AZ095b]|uniref:GntR family transcriptional regulator n=1 Tax=Enterococcus sp. AZ095b TaxID=2774791 RepID=UPI003F685152
MEELAMLYKKLEKKIQINIEQNNMQPGEKLLSIRNLASLYSCSKNTIIKVLEELKKKKLSTQFRKKDIF